MNAYNRGLFGSMNFGQPVDRPVGGSVGLPVIPGVDPNLGQKPAYNKSNSFDWLQFMRQNGGAAGPNGAGNALIQEFMKRKNGNGGGDDGSASVYKPTATGTTPVAGTPFSWGAWAAQPGVVAGDMNSVMNALWSQYGGANANPYTIDYDAIYAKDRAGKSGGSFKG